jgi:hypothetical protein
LGSWLAWLKPYPPEIKAGRNRRFAKMRPKKYEERYYSPRFSEMASVTIRRLAWFLGVPMTQAVELFIREIALIFTPSLVCQKCKDSTKCHACGFNQKTAAEKTAATETANAVSTANAA